MKQIIQKACMVVAVLLLAWSGRAQTNITAAEYFFDNDPGFGNGTQVSVTPAANLSGLLFNANVAALSTGIHTLYVRTKDANNKWSLTYSYYIAKVQNVGANPNTTSNISTAEYFFDNDPGYGNGSAIAIAGGSSNISSLAFNAAVGALSTGIHTLYVRSKDATGWSQTTNYYFAKIQAVQGNPNSISNIVKAEYFFDTDPGYAGGTDIPLTPGTDISGLVFNATVSSLTNGVHTLYVRTKDAQGKWSITNAMLFAKVQSLAGNPNTVSNITKAEYFFNTDPGYGNGVDIPLTAANDVNGLVANLNIASLPTGLHTLYLRTKDAQGKWSITTWYQFSRIQGLSPNPASLSKINKAEYFFDTDPGFGFGTNIPIPSPAYDVNALTFNADVSALSSGMHTFYVRTRDSSGQWSVTRNFYFVRVQPLATNPHTTSNIVKMEYFYDADPGYGNGTDVPVTPALDISGITMNANVTALTNGVHTLFVRSKDAQGKWSIVSTVNFAKVQALGTNPHSKSNLTRIEYFVDTDPGFGNGIPLSFTQDTNVTSLAFNVDMTVLVNGGHTLYVRSKDAQGKWGITYVHQFNGGTAALAVKLISFDAMLQPEKTVKLQWLTAEERNVDRYEVARSADASNWFTIGTVAPNEPGSDGRHHYSLDDATPGRGVIYYRLTEVDHNGSTTQAPIRFVTIRDDETTFASLFPNPNDGKQLTISSSIFKDGEVLLTIVAADGRLEMQQLINNKMIDQFTLNNLSLAAGNYFVNLVSKEHSETLKLQVTGDRL